MEIEITLADTTDAKLAVGLPRSSTYRLAINSTSIYESISNKFTNRPTNKQLSPGLWMMIKSYPNRIVRLSYTYHAPMKPKQGYYILEEKGYTE